MPGVEGRPGRFTQLDFDSLATVAEYTQPEHGSAVQRPDVQPFSGTRHKFVLKPGGIQYTLDVLLDQPTQEGTEAPDAAGAGQVGARQPAVQPFSGTRHKYSLVPGGIQYTLDALFAPSTQDEKAAISEPAERQHPYEHPKPATTQFTFDTLADLPSDDVSGAGAGEHTGSTPERDSRTVVRPDVRPGDRKGDGLRSSQGDSSQPVPAAGRRLRLDEPEPEPARLTRDFRITDAHQIGVGGLNEKARANVAAIRLLKDIEAAHRDASDEEKASLVRYAGWGALAQVFEPEERLKHEWQAAATELTALLTEQEYTSARATTPNAHFTSPLVISAIWNGLGKLGVTGCLDVLEPAVGVGHFFGLMPAALQGGYRTGVELDGLTARIARTLYPDAAIFPQGFETTHFPDNFFDLVVSNVPFGDYPVHDPSMKRALTRAIHDYFFAKSLAKVRAGGVMALISSRYTMDKQDGTIRNYLAEQADLLAAMRLPNTAFKGNAGTEVTTDILFLQKRHHEQEPAGQQL